MKRCHGFADPFTIWGLVVAFTTIIGIAKAVPQSMANNGFGSPAPRVTATEYARINGLGTSVSCDPIKAKKNGFVRCVSDTTEFFCPVNTAVVKGCMPAGSDSRFISR